MSGCILVSVPNSVGYTIKIVSETLFGTLRYMKRTQVWDSDEKASRAETAIRNSLSHRRCTCTVGRGHQYNLEARYREV